jgi:hypothetical protein
VPRASVHITPNCIRNGAVGRCMGKRQLAIETVKSF